MVFIGIGVGVTLEMLRRGRKRQRCCDGFDPFDKLRASKQHDAISARPLRLGFVQAGVEMLVWKSQKRSQLPHTAPASMASGTTGCAKTHFCQTKPIIMDKYLAIVSLWDKVLWR
jgi:hypothetical protein